MKRFYPLALQLLWSAAGFTAIHLGNTHQADAQITPDTTLSGNSQVVTRGNQRIITGGTQSGRNLFHSFRNFSVPARSTASFQEIDPGVQNIFTRVTGSSASRINGTIEAWNRDGSLSGATFFLINPNGIIFGPRASLNIGGSFIAATANSITFQDGTQFSAINPQADSLLTVSVPVGVQFGRDPSRLINRSEVPFNADAPLVDSAGNPLPPPFNDPDIDSFEGLRVAPNQTIALLGSNVQFLNGELTAPGGHIEVASLGGAGQVRLIQRNPGWQFSYDPQQPFSDLQLWNVDLNVSGDRAGSISIQGDRIQVASPFGGGLRAYTYSQDSGTVRIRGHLLTVEENGFISTETFGSGQGGDIQIDADRVVLSSGGQISANTNASGQGGNLRINANESVEIVDVLRRRNGQPELSNGLPISSGLFARVVCLSKQECGGATGQGGNISIATRQLRLLSGGQISADTYAVGNAGSITVRAASVEILGTVLDVNSNSITADGGRTAPSSLSTISATETSGNAGQVRIETDRLTVRDGATLQSSTLGSGNGGDLWIRATESIDLTGVGAGTEVPSGLFSFSGGIPETTFELNRSATGRAGNLTLRTRSLTIQDRAVIAVGSANPGLDERGRAGNLRIDAAQLQANNQAGLLANTNSGQGGNIRLQIADLLLLSRNSQISTTAGSERRGGDGGNINLNSRSLIASPNTNTDITANAFTGNGGTIDINAESIVGLTATDTLTPRSNAQNDITASSASGINGEININGVRTDLTRGLQLPDAPASEPLLAQTCRPVTDATGERSSFVISGRGGVPPSPYDTLSSDDLWQDWRLTAVEPETSSRSETADRPSSPRSSTYRQTAPIEAQGWIRNAAGQVELVAQTGASESMLSNSPRAPLSLPNCSAVPAPDRSGEAL